jgi:hypothetical protein
MQLSLKSHAVGSVLVIAFAAFICSCGSQQQEIDKLRASLTSLRATTAAVSNAWLNGQVSTVYIGTTLDTTEALLRRDRETLLSMPPDALSDPAARSLGDAQGRLARVLAALSRAVDANDATGVRTNLALIAAPRPRVP